MQGLKNVNASKPHIAIAMQTKEKTRSMFFMKWMELGISLCAFPQR